MSSVESLNEYIHKSRLYLSHSIEARMLYLEIKNRKIQSLTSQSNIDTYLRILKKQRYMVLDLKKKRKHLNTYTKKKLSQLKCSRKTKKILYKKINQLEILYIWTYSQTKFIKQQYKVLDLEFEYQSNSKFKFKRFFLKIFKQDLKSNVLQEESELYLTMKVYEHRNKDLFSYSSQMRKLEHFSHLELLFLKIALFCNSLPIHGVGDLLSIPFWILYGIMQGYERTFKDYKDWKNTKHMDLKTLHKELEKIENLL